MGSGNAVAGGYRQQGAGLYHRERYLECYDGSVRNKMDHAGNRADYRECCRYLNLMIKLGGRDRVQQIMADWRAAYPWRRAMLDELQLVKV